MDPEPWPCLCRPLSLCEVAATLVPLSLGLRVHLGLGALSLALALTSFLSLRGANKTLCLLAQGLGHLLGGPRDMGGRPAVGDAPSPGCHPAVGTSHQGTLQGHLQGSRGGAAAPVLAKHLAKGPCSRIFGEGGTHRATLGHKSLSARPSPCAQWEPAPTCHCRGGPSLLRPPGDTWGYLSGGTLLCTQPPHLKGMG